MLAPFLLAGAGEARARAWDVTAAEDISACPDVGLCVVESRTRYRVEGRSDRHFVDELKDAGAREAQSAHALTEFGITLSYDLQAHPEGCRIERIGMRMEVDMQLPRLVDDVRSSAERRSQWRQAREGLNRHERGHVDLAYEHAGRLLEALHALPVSADCGGARRAAGREYMRHSMRHALAQQLYDQRTGSGARQGAVVALPTGERAQALPLMTFPSR